jgi:hypothetical protein
MSDFIAKLNPNSDLGLKELQLVFLKQAKGHCKFKILTPTAHCMLILTEGLRKHDLKNLDLPLYAYLPLRSHFFSSYIRLTWKDAESPVGETVLINLKDQWIIAKQKSTVLEVAQLLAIVPLPLQG